MEQHASSIANLILWVDIALAIWTLIMFVAGLAVIILVVKVKALLDKVEGMLDPLASKSEQVLERVDTTLVTLKNKAESMLDVSEHAVKTVAEKVDTTSSLVEATVARPAISLSSIMAGINRGLETWRHFDARSSESGVMTGDGTTEVVIVSGPDSGMPAP